MAKPALAKKAAFAGDPKALAEALEGRGSRQAASQTESDGRPLLAYAAAGKSGDEQSALCVNLLVAAGADPNAADTNGQTALHWASRFGRARCVAALLRAGSDPEALTSFGMRPLELAILGGSAQAVKELAEAGSDLATFKHKDMGPLDYAASLLSRPDQGKQELAKRAAVHEYLALHAISAQPANSVRRASL
jgi:ankyrin repeat protein